MSISSSSNVSQIMQDIDLVNKNARNFDILSKQLSTGRRHEALRDYGTFVSKIINMQGVVSTRESYIRAIDLVSFNVESYQETLGEIDALTRQVFKAAGEAPPNATDAVGLAGWRNTVSNTSDLLLRQLEAILNTNVGGKYLFSGNQYQRPALKDLTKLQTFAASDVRNPEIHQYQTLNNLPQGAVHFAAGQTTATVTVQIAGDRQAEANPEQFKLHLDQAVTVDANQTASSIVEPDALGTIEDNDTTISIKNVGVNSLAEGSTYTFEVNRQGGDLSAASTVYLDNLRGSDVDISDFGVAGDGVNAVRVTTFDANGTPTTTTDDYPLASVSFPANSSRIQIEVVTSNDNTTENNEHFALKIRPDVNYNIDENANVASAHINDNDDTKAYLSIARTSAATQAEASGGAHTFTITRENAYLNSEPQVVRWSVDGENSSMDAKDFGGTFPSGMVTFLAGETSKTITVNVNDDQTVEADESFQIKIDGGNVIQSHAEATVSNDEVSFGIKALDADKKETGSHSFVVTRSGDASVPSTVQVDSKYLSDGTAVTTTETVAFAAGETEKIVTFTSSDRALDDTIQVVLKNAVGDTSGTPAVNGYIESYASTAEGKVYNVDPAATKLSVATTATSTVTEGDTGVTTSMTFTVTRTGPNPSTDWPEEYVSYSVQGTNASNSADSKDFADGYGIVPSYVATDASGATAEFTYMYNTVAGQKDPLLWQQQSIGLRDGESQEYGVTATDPAFQKLIRALLILKSSAETRNTGQETAMLDAARDIVNEATTEVRQLIAANSVVVNSIETTRAAHVSFNTLAKNKLGAITDIDPAEAAAELTALQSMVNASYSLIAKRAKLSLANFL